MSEKVTPKDYGRWDKTCVKWGPKPKQTKKPVAKKGKANGKGK